MEGPLAQATQSKGCADQTDSTDQNGSTHSGASDWFWSCCFWRAEASNSTALFNMDKREMIEERLTGSVIGAFFEVYNSLGFGYLEHLYTAALERELHSRGHRVARELAVRVMYKGEEIGCQRLDMVVDDVVVVEVKSTGKLSEIAPRQVRNYLRATNLEVGLLLHFGPAPRFHRVICENRLKRAR